MSQVIHTDSMKNSPARGLLLRNSYPIFGWAVILSGIREQIFVYFPACIYDVGRIFRVMFRITIFILMEPKVLHRHVRTKKVSMRRVHIKIFIWCMQHIQPIKKYSTTFPTFFSPFISSPSSTLFLFMHNQFEYIQRRCTSTILLSVYSTR